MCLPSIISYGTNNKIEEFENVLRLTSFQKPQLQSVFLQVCPSVPPFVFAVLIIPSFDVLSGYFCVSIIW